MAWSERTFWCCELGTLSQNSITTASMGERLLRLWRIYVLWHHHAAGKCMTQVIYLHANLPSRGMTS